MFGRRNQRSLDVAEAMAGQRAGHLRIVDVREDHERARGSVPGSRHLPLSQLEQRLDELPADRSVAFICQSGRRSAKAAKAARRAGVDAYDVAGGMTAWERKGSDVDRKTT